MKIFLRAISLVAIFCIGTSKIHSKNLEKTATASDNPATFPEDITVDCDAGTQTFNYCYDSNDTETFTFTSTSGAPIILEFAAGSIESCCDFITIYDGSDTSGAVLFDGNNNGDLSGVSVQSTGDSLFLSIDSDFSVSCQSSLTFNEWEMEYRCVTCIAPEVNYDIVDDCANGEQFFVDVEILDVGDALSINISDDQGSDQQSTSDIGTFTFGPFANGTDVNITVEDADDVNCTLFSGTLSQAFCPDQTCAILNAGPDVVTGCGEATSIDLSATFMESSFTSDTSVYTIGQLDCPVSNLEGTPTGLNIDDRWSQPIDLGFSFEFFGQTYTQVVAGANGLIGFDVSLAGTFCPWSFEPDELIPTPELPTNAIHGAYHDIDPSQGGFIEFTTVGVAPERQFKLSFREVPHFSSACNDSLFTTQQIILYESSNVIDVIVTEKPVCDSWNDGLAVIGIQNATGTVGYTPPGRNTGAWAVTEQELWRFIPDGNPNYLFEWLDEDGNPISNDTDITVNPTETTTYTASVIYSGTDGSFVTITDDVVVTILTDGPEPGQVNNLVECANPMGTTTFNLTDQDSDIINGQPNVNVVYFENETNAQNGSDPITDATAYENSTSPQTIYFRLELNSSSDCFTVGSFDLVTTTLETNALDDLVDCTNAQGVAVFNLTDQDDAIINGQPDVNVSYFESQTSAENGTDAITDPETYENSISPLTIYYRIEQDSNSNCFAVGSFNLTISTFDVNLIGVEQGCQGNDYVMSISPVDNSYDPNTVTYEWFGPIGADTTNNTSDSFVGTVDGTYTVEITTAEGCVYSKDIEAVNAACVFPAGISPNNDMSNDRFDLSAFNVQEIQIFNRQGRSVYKKTNYVDEWEGQSDNAGELPVGVYFYVARLESGETRNGWIYIQR